jgi:hypothetical protein
MLNKLKLLPNNRSNNFSCSSVTEAVYERTVMNIGLRLDSTRCGASIGRVESALAPMC